MFKIHCISDTHNKHKQIYLPGGDIILHAGDATGRGTSGEIKAFLKWYGSLDFTYKIMVAGNHDWGFEKEPERFEKMCEEYGITYLNDSGVTIKDFDTEKEIKIWGSPVQPEFCNWAFNRAIYEADERYLQIKPHWDMIPSDTDILITHGPPMGVLDGVQNAFHDPYNVTHVGCPHLMKAIERVNPKLHIFGHIHEEHGHKYKDKTLFINAAILNDAYNVAYKPVEIEWDEEPRIK